MTLATAVRRVSILLSVPLFLSACENLPGAAPTDSSPAAPVGIGSGQAVDGLTVGHRMMEGGQYEPALAAYTRAMGEQGLTPDVLTGIASAQMKLGRLNQARHTFYVAIEKDERNVPAWNNLGVTLIGLQEYAEAREAFKVAYGLDAGNSPEIRANLILLDKYNISSGVEFPAEDEFVLVRGGNGVYFLLSPKEQ